MNQKIIPGVVLVGALAIGGIGWLAVPALQTAQATVNQQVGVDLERARRILHDYNHELTFDSLLLDRLAGFGVDVDLENGDELLDQYADEYQQAHEAAWAAYPPYDYNGVDAEPRQAKARYGNLQAQAREGVRALDDRFDKNNADLDDALDAVNRALGVTAGDADSRMHAEANRLKGVILSQQAIAARLEALMLRQDALPLRQELTELGQVAGAVPQSEAATTDETLTKVLSERLNDATRTLEAKTTALEQLNRKIADMEARLADARRRADAARRAIDELTRTGIDLSRADGAQEFAATLTEQDRLFRAADAEARALEFGTLPNARLESGGDYLTGEYADAGSQGPPVVEPGLNYYRHEHAVLSREVELGQAAVDGFRADIERTEGLAAAAEAEKQTMQRRATEARTRAGEVFTELNRLESEAYTVEDEALSLLDQAVRAFNQAAQGATDWVNAGGEASQGLAPETRERSAAFMQSQAGWMGGHIKAQQADALLEKARIQYTRFSDSNRTAATLAACAGPLGLNEADDKAEAEKAADAHDAAVDEIDQAMRILERSHRDTGRHWSFVAQEAAIDELMAELGHPEYRADAIEAYRSALANRAEDDETAAPFRLRLEQLERGE